MSVMSISIVYTVSYRTVVIHCNLWGNKQNSKLLCIDKDSRFGSDGAWFAILSPADRPYSSSSATEIVGLYNFEEQIVSPSLFVTIMFSYGPVYFFSKTVNKFIEIFKSVQRCILFWWCLQSFYHVTVFNMNTFIRYIWLLLCSTSHLTFKSDILLIWKEFSISWQSLKGAK